MINYEPKMGESISDSIIILLNKGHSESEIFNFIKRNCPMVMKSKWQQASMLNHISKLNFSADKGGIHDSI
jgi:hypothetical protein